MMRISTDFSWLHPLVGYIHLGAALANAVLGGTMGGKMPGRSLAYPAWIRYTQGGIAVALAAVGYCWLTWLDLVPPATAVLVSIIALQAVFLLFISLGQLTTRKQKIDYLTRVAPFAIVVFILTLAVGGISRIIRNQERNGAKLDKVLESIPTKPDSTKH